MHVLGASGRGKSKFLEHLIRSDILAGNGLCVIDPHGYLYHDLIRWCETKGLLERKPIVLFDPTADNWSFGFNPLDFGRVSGDEVSYAVDSMVRACAQVWGGEDTTKTPLLKRCLRSIFHALAEHKLTLLEAVDLVSAEDAGGVRRYLTERVSDPVIRAQWADFNDMEPPQFRDTFASTSNRLMEFLAAGFLRTIIGQRHSIIDFGALMDQGGMLLVNLSASGRLSDDNARLLGTLLVSDLFLKARRRPPRSRPFYLYIDECALFINEDVARILDEGRKFGIHLILANQHLSQLRTAGEKVYSAVMTNAQTKVVFGGLTPEDARTMAELVFIGEHNLEESKVRFEKPVVTGYIRTWLHNRSHSQSAGATSSTGSAETSPIVEGVEEEEPTSINRSSGESSTYSASVSRGESESLVPVLQYLPGVAYSLEEQIYRSMALMVNQPTQRAIVKLPGAVSRRVTTPYVAEAVARDERVAAFKLRAFGKTPFAQLREPAEGEINKRQLELRKKARAYTSPDDPKSFFE
jgi:hypothetical protein